MTRARGRPGLVRARRAGRAPRAGRHGSAPRPEPGRRGGSRRRGDHEGLAAPSLTPGSGSGSPDGFSWIMTNLFISHRRSDAVRHEETGLDEETEFSLFERLHQPFLLWWGTPEQDFLNRLLRGGSHPCDRGAPGPVSDRRRHGRRAGALLRRDSPARSEIPVGTVRSRLARGRALLQKALWEHACDAGLRSGALDERPGHP